MSFHEMLPYEILDVKNDKIKVSKLTLSKLSIIFLVVQISVRKPKIKKDKNNIKLHKDLFYVHSVHEFHIQILVLTLILISLGANFFSSLNSLSPNPKIENFRYMESYSHVLHFHTLTIELNDTFPFNLDRTLTIS